MYSVTPTHEPFVSPTGLTDSADPSGWLYTLNGYEYGDPNVELNSKDISSLWTGQSIGISYTGCKFDYCDLTRGSVAGAGAAQTQAYLFATTTLTTSGSRSSSEATMPGLPNVTPVKTTSVEVDPVAASPTISVPISPTQNPSTLPAVEVDSSVTGTRSASVSAAPETAEQRSTASAVVLSASPNQATISGTEDSSLVSSSHPISQIIPLMSTESGKEGSSPEVGTQSTEISSIAMTAASSQLEQTMKVTSQANDISEYEVASQSATDVPVSQATTTTERIGDVIASIIGLVVTAPPVANEALDGGTEPSPTSFVSHPLPSSHDSSAIGMETLTSSMDDSSQIQVPSPSLALQSQVTVSSGSSTTLIVSASTFESSSTIQVGCSSSKVYKTSAGPTTETILPPIVINGATVNPNVLFGYAISGQTLMPGSSITVRSGSSTTVIALSTGPSGTVLYIESSRMGLVPSSISPMTHSMVPIIIGGSTITPDASGLYVVDGQTIVPGSAIILGSGSATTATLVIQTSGSQTIVIAGSSTSTLPQQGTASTRPASALPTLTIDSFIAHPNSASEYVIDSHTLLVGGNVVTLSNSLVISLASDATGPVISAVSPSSPSSGTTQSDSSSPGVSSHRPTSGARGSSAATGVEGAASSSVQATGSRNDAQQGHEKFCMALCVISTVVLALL